MEILKVNNSNLEEVISKAILVLQSGGMIIYPTETCYGIGVDATDNNAVNKLLEYKERPEGKAISIAVSSQQMAEHYVEINSEAKNIYKNFLPGPVTVISKSKGKVSNQLESEHGTLGIRIPDHKLPLAIINAYSKPITSTSANLAGRANPYDVEILLDSLSQKKKDMIDLVIDFGKLPTKPPSTVVDTTLSELNVIRQGDIYFSQNMREYLSDNLSKTAKLAANIILSIDNDLREYTAIFLLNGDMGAGKTHFVKGIAKHLGIKDSIKSPTYTIVSEYLFNRNNKQNLLFHLDLWRIERAEELEHFNLQAMIKPGNIIAIEWANKFKQSIQALKGNIIFINMSFISKDQETRLIQYEITKR